MATGGLFTNRGTSGGRAFAAARSRNRLAANGKGYAENKALLAEALASDIFTSAVAAGISIGISRNMALRLFRAIRADLGEQAR